MNNTTAEVVRTGMDAFDAWFGTEGVEESHARMFLSLAYAMMAANAAAGTLTEHETALRWSAAMMAAFQLGRASVEVGR